MAEDGNLAAMVGEAAARVVEILTVHGEAMSGYRRRLEGQGWSPTMAEHVAAQALAQLNHESVHRWLRTPTPRGGA